jgi:hypothetical protein
MVFAVYTLASSNLNQSGIHNLIRTRFALLEFKTHIGFKESLMAKVAAA